MNKKNYFICVYYLLLFFFSDKGSFILKIVLLIIKMRRFYEVLGSAATSLVFWLLALLVLSVTEMRSDAFKANPFVSYSFFVLQLPLYTLVMFGSYSLCSIGYYLMALGKIF